MLGSNAGYLCMDNRFPEGQVFHSKSDFRASIGQIGLIRSIPFTEVHEFETTEVGFVETPKKVVFRYACVPISEQLFVR